MLLLELSVKCNFKFEKIEKYVVFFSYRRIKMNFKTEKVVKQHLKIIITCQKMQYLEKNFLKNKKASY